MDEEAGTWAVDLDGVVWLAQEPIPGSAEALGRLRGRGTDVVFVTNNALPTRAELVARLARAGIDATPDDLVTSAQAAASMLEPRSRAVVCGGAGLREALEERGVTMVETGPADAVVVGLTRDFDFSLLDTAAAAVRHGARLVGTNDDATYPTPGHLSPGAGALLAAVATAGQAAPEIAGKPHDPIVALLRKRAPAVAVVVGDRPSTDGLLARRLGVPFALVRSGVTGRGRGPMVVVPDIDAEDLSAVVDHPRFRRVASRRVPLLPLGDGRSVAAMPSNDGLRRYLEAGLAFTQITRARAEELVHELIQAGEVEAIRAQEWVEDLVRTSRERSDTLLSTVHGEVRSQLSDLGITNIDDVAHRVAEILDRAESAARRATSRGPGRGRPAPRQATRRPGTKPASRPSAKKAATKRAPAKKTAARKTTKKAATKRAPAKKTAARKTTKSAATKRAPAKKTAKATTSRARS